MTDMMDNLVNKGWYSRPVSIHSELTMLSQDSRYSFLSPEACRALCSIICHVLLHITHQNKHTLHHMQK